MQTLLSYLPTNPLKWDDGRDKPDEYNSSPKENIDQLSILSYEEGEKEEKRLLHIV